MRSFGTRLTLALALLLLGYGTLVAVLGRQLQAEQEQAALQRVSHRLAEHVVGHWPQIKAPDATQADRAARAQVLQMLMVVNPGVQVYVLDAQGRVDAYLGEPGMVRQPQVDLAVVRAFLAGAALPLRGTDPMAPPGAAPERVFSAAMFAPRAGDEVPPGYLYIVLDGGARAQVAAQLAILHGWQRAAGLGAVGLLATFGVGLFTFRRLTLPLHRLAQRMRSYRGPDGTPAAASGDEVQALAGAFDAMTARIERQAAQVQHQGAAHREMMAGVAHDLRTPLTALHGHLEALGAGGSAGSAPRLLAVALAQSDKVRRLSQQLFELAALESSAEVLHRERFNLDELVADAVQKFALADGTPAATLAGAPPGRIEIDGDMQLIERALSNLIDNAMRHAAPPVRVRLQRAAGVAQIVVDDAGPGLPADLQRRLAAGSPLREAPARRSSGGIGGLGLAIAQRVAVLHGGSLRPLPAPGGGASLCLALPLALISPRA